MDPTLKVPPEVGVIILSATVEDVESQVHNDRISSLSTPRTLKSHHVLLVLGLKGCQLRISVKSAQKLPQQMVFLSHSLVGTRVLKVMTRPSIT